MKDKFKNFNKWRKLDNTAKIFPVISGKNLSNVFRLSSILKQDIVPELLQIALENVLPHFKAFSVKLKKGFFWYYFDINTSKPIIKKETKYPCSYIKSKTNNGYLFRLTFFDKRINLEVFHSVTDGTGAISFLKAITYEYIKIANNLDITTTQVLSYVNISNDIEDSYIKNYAKQNAKTPRDKKAYKIKSNVLPLNMISVMHGHIDLDILLKKCRSMHVTITEYFTAVLIWSIYQNYINSKEKVAIYPVRVFVPVNLRNFFNSSTVMNFFSNISVEMDFTRVDLEFDDMLNLVCREFKKKLTKENFESKISNNVSTEKNLFIRLSPLFIKKIGGKIGYIEASKSHTSTLSNIGKIDVIDGFVEYIDSFSFILPPSKQESIKCTICSYNNKLVVTFSSILDKPKYESIFFRKISEDIGNIKLESNGVYNEIL